MYCIEKEQGTDDDEGDGETSKILDTVREGYWDFLHYLTANFHFTLTFTSAGDRNGMC